MSEKFNYHKVLFTLETIKSSEKKISFLYGVKVDLNRVIQCFSRKKFQPLKKYAEPNIFAEDGCPELTNFLKEVIGCYNSPQYGDRYISDEILNRHLKEEVKKIKNFIKMVDSEIEYWITQRDNEKNNSNKKKEENMKVLNQKDSDLLNKKLDEEMASTSMRELIENNQKKITWKGSKEDLIHFFDQLFSQRLLSIKSYDEIFSIVAHYFVNEDGDPIIIEKSASAKMNLNGPKIPVGYERYMKSIEKLKSD